MQLFKRPEAILKLLVSFHYLSNVGIKKLKPSLEVTHDFVTVPGA